MAEPSIRELLERIAVRGYLPHKFDDRADAMTALARLEDARKEIVNAYEPVAFLRADSQPGSYEWNMARIALKHLDALLALVGEVS